ncbi:hypothetical protein VNO80_17081 [Phaseolus coccineus]|uniref:Uncharacterized protein n=1 Tax=Phaseolus coccineus TaxID=3886 RepID=A0AAN9R0Q5_PHACN
MEEELRWWRKDEQAVAERKVDERMMTIVTTCSLVAISRGALRPPSSGYFVLHSFVFFLHLHWDVEDKTALLLSPLAFATPLLLPPATFRCFYMEEF